MRAPSIPTLLYLLFLVPLDVAAQRYVDPAAVDSAIRHICANGSTAPNVDSLLKSERRSAMEYRDGTTGDATWSLTCTRALLANEGVVGKPSVRMPVGTGWRYGATVLALDIARAQPLGPAPTLIAWLNHDPVLTEPAETLVGMYHPAVISGNASGVVARACVATATASRSEVEREGCSRTALHAGWDSTFHLIAHARAAAARGDTAVALRQFAAGAAAASDSAARQLLEWHLRWMLSPDELTEWRAVADTDPAAFAMAALLERDLRDGRDPGARLMAHFQRLGIAERDFRIHPLPIHRDRLTSGAAIGDASGGGFTVGPFTGGSNTPANQMREFTRWQTEFDDRGVVYMRFGPPTKRYFYSAYGVGNYLRRETWRYDLDGDRLLLSFESELSDGSQEATRLVTGVIGDHFCGIDLMRCHIGERALAAAEWNDNNPASPMGIQYAERATLQERDRENIREATTKDDNAVRYEEPLPVVAHARELWDPRTGASVLLVPWAIPASALRDSVAGGSRLATVDLEWRAADLSSGEWWDTTVVTRLRLPERVERAAHVTGVIAARVPFGATSWSLWARQDTERGGRVFEAERRPIGNAALALSDLVIGAESQGLSWPGWREAIPLAPLGTVDRRAPVSLYFQVRSDRPLTDGAVTVTVYRPTRDADEAAFSVAFTSRFTSGISEVRRDLGLDRLESGRYRLEVTLTAPDGRSVVRSAPLYLR